MDGRWNGLHPGGPLRGRVLWHLVAGIGYLRPGQGGHAQDPPGPQGPRAPAAQARSGLNSWAPPPAPGLVMRLLALPAARGASVLALPDERGPALGCLPGLRLSLNVIRVADSYMSAVQLSRANTGGPPLSGG